MFLPAKHFTIFIPTAHNKNRIFLKLYDIPPFRLHWPSSGRWLTKTRVVANYVTDVQLHFCATFGVTIVTTYKIYIQLYLDETY